MLIMHGTADRVFSIDATARRLPKLIRDIHLRGGRRAPHGMLWTHAEEVNRALLTFLRQQAPVGAIN
jgi:non-heme chloroperoxidase